MGRVQVVLAAGLVLFGAVDVLIGAPLRNLMLVIAGVVLVVVASVYLLLAIRNLLRAGAVVSEGDPGGAALPPAASGPGDALDGLGGQQRRRP
jgi:hypothetical protein